jgi:hypothetical protein
MGRKPRNDPICGGINYKRVDCDRYVSKEEKYCTTHKYFDKFTDVIIESPITYLPILMTLYIL